MGQSIESVSSTSASTPGRDTDDDSDISLLANMLYRLDESQDITNSTMNSCAHSDCNDPSGSNNINNNIDKIQEEITPTIFNLSSTVLTQDDIDLLKNGLKFIPSPKRLDNVEFESDIMGLSDKVKWNYAFNKPLVQHNTPMVSSPSQKYPPKPKNAQIKLLLNNIESITPQLKSWTNYHKNMPNKLYKALERLIQSDTIIKSADKGSGVVLMDNDFYNDAIREMLSDTNTYSPVEMDCGTLILKIEAFVYKWRSVFTKYEQDVITKEPSDMAFMYGLPKIHKSKSIQEATNLQKGMIITIHRPKDLKFRPIISCRKCPTTKLCQALDTLLRAFIPKLTYCIKDTWDFLRRLPTDVEPDCYMVTADITSLYTNISTEKGCESITYFYEKYPDLIEKRVSLKFLLELYVFCQENLYFNFGNETHQQTTGAGMGKIYAPALANIKIAYDEIILEEFIRRTFSEEIASYFLNNYVRFLDDVWFLWRMAFEGIDRIKEKMGRIDKNIQYVFSYSNTTTHENSIPFLDVLLTIKNGKLDTDIYAKETDTFNYLPFSSSHPRHVARNIPFVLAKRIKGIVSSDEKVKSRISEMRDRLKNKGYPNRVIDAGIKKANLISREAIITHKSTTPPNNNATNDVTLVTIPESNNINPNPRSAIGGNIQDHINKPPQIEPKPVYFVSTFNEKCFPIDDKIKNAVTHFNSIKQCKDNKLKINVSHRRSPSLRDLLMHKKNKNKSFSVSKCKKGCVFCEYLIEGTSVTLKNGITVHTNFNFQCKSRNCLYIAICGGCNEFYVGETGDKLSSRFSTHRNQGKESAFLVPVQADQHFRVCGNNEYQVYPFLRPKRNSRVLRQAQERYWIKKLRPTLNGLDKKGGRYTQ